MPLTKLREYFRGVQPKMRRPAVIEPPVGASVACAPQIVPLDRVVMLQREIAAHMARVPTLACLCPSEPAVAEVKALQGLRDQMMTFLAINHPPSRGVATRNLLHPRIRHRDGAAAPTPALLTYIESCLDDGLIERAARLARGQEGLPAHLRNRIADDSAGHDQHYGAACGHIACDEHWSILAATARDKLDCTLRGRCLTRYFEIARGLACNLSVLHIAPEPDLARYLRAHLDRGGRYVTLDAFAAGVDLQQDLTKLELASAQFDMVICHRVLEHVLDDRAALSELRRVLKVGGILNVSVPQSMHIDTTIEWSIGELALGGHVRQYGRDFEGRLTQAGFAVELVDFLLRRTLDEHEQDTTYPMRFYECVSL